MTQSEFIYEFTAPPELKSGNYKTAFEIVKKWWGAPGSTNIDIIPLIAAALDTAMDRGYELGWTEGNIDMVEGKTSLNQSESESEVK